MDFPAKNLKKTNDPFLRKMLNQRTARQAMVISEDSQLDEVSKKWISQFLFYLYAKTQNIYQFKINIL